MTSSDLYRLQDSVIIDPLVNQWVACPATFAPIPASLHLAQYQIPLLESYNENPALHEMASCDPELSGGSFASVPAERAPEMQALLERSKTLLEPSLKCARDLIDFQNWLTAHANGQSLEPLYEKVPPSLRGYVELVYDYYNRPSVRVIEGLTYHSPYYRKDLQSLQLAQVDRDEGRPHFLNTPRLANHDTLEFAWPFDDSRVDALMELTAMPATLSSIASRLQLDEKGLDKLIPFLTGCTAPKREPWTGGSVRIRYFGHACVLVECNGVSFITDPFVPLVPREAGLERYTYHDLPEHIDYALVTHNHQDHFWLETLMRFRPRLGCLVVPKCHGIQHGDMSMKMLAQRAGFRNVVELDTMETIGFEGGEIIAVPFLGEHSDMAQGKCGYVVRAGMRQILFAADSDCLDRAIYSNLRRAIGKVDTVFLGMESVGAPLSFGYRSYLPIKPTEEQDQGRRQHGSDAVRGLQLVQELGATRVYNYAMGLEPWLQFILGLNLDEWSPQWQESSQFLKALHERGFEDAQRLYAKHEIVLEQPALHYASAR
jgi:L-ascorbate metabolism protein UlaG (beta-lactamase superfamily)